MAPISVCCWVFTVLENPAPSVAARAPTLASRMLLSLTTPIAKISTTTCRLVRHVETFSNFSSRLITILWQTITILWQTASRCCYRVWKLALARWRGDWLLKEMNERESQTANLTNVANGYQFSKPINEHKLNIALNTWSNKSHLDSLSAADQWLDLRSSNYL